MLAADIDLAINAAGNLLAAMTNPQNPSEVNHSERFISTSAGDDLQTISRAKIGSVRGR